MTDMNTKNNAVLWLAIIQTMTLYQLAQAQSVIVVGTREYQPTEVRVIAHALDSISAASVTRLGGGNLLFHLLDGLLPAETGAEKDFIGLLDGPDGLH